MKDKNIMVGIGKMMLKKKVNKVGNIPYLHFLVEKDETGEYIAMNLELLVTASGDSEEEAITNLSHITISYINDLLELSSGYEQLIDLAKSCSMERYWSKYREFEFRAAEQGKDLGHTIEEDIQNRLRRMITDKFFEQAAECISKEVAELLEDMLTDVYGLSISYTERDAA